MLANYHSWRLIYIAFCAVGAVSSIIYIIRIAAVTSSANAAKVEGTIAPHDLLAVPEKEISYPLEPKALTGLGVCFACFIFGLSGILLLATSMPPIPSAAINSMLGMATEVAASMTLYVFRLRKDKNIIYLPKAIGLTGKVAKDIPASKKGVGTIRIFMNGQIVSVQAMSVDEVILAKDADIKIIYADDDRIVVVERMIPSGLV
ncbi:MAG: hypothetical protein FWG10_05465 [Eubacteriaceae bacterium]|nr:hypothetical protein [Eubacteriaceae bacterium]